jgi:ribosomal protein L44E
MSCKELPAEDVEGCISYMKLNVPFLNPSKAEDREKLAYEVTKFFADPGRKYNREISRLEAEKEGMKSEMEDIRREYERKLGDIGKKIKEQQLQHDEELKKRDLEFKDLKKKFNEFEKNVQRESLKRKALWRVSFLGSLFLLLEVLITFLAHEYGEGYNLFKKFLRPGHIH